MLARQKINQLGEGEGVSWRGLPDLAKHFLFPGFSDV
jgi:hypothetical protein